MSYLEEQYTVTVKPESGKYLATVTKREAGSYDPREQKTYYRHTPLSVSLADTKDEALNSAVREAFDF